MTDQLTPINHCATPRANQCARGEVTITRGLLGSLLLLVCLLALLPIPAQAAAPILDAPALTTDPRYGFGGRTTEGIDYLGIPIYRRWGENGNADALEALARGAQSYFVVGKIDTREYNSLNQRIDWLSYGPRCLRSAQDDTLVSCTEAPNTAIPNHPDWEQIPDLAARYPGQIWEIANEPDWNPYFAPEQYAVWYHRYAQHIRHADPTAQIMIGGLLMCCGEGVYEHFQLRRSDWDTQIANANTRHAWTTRFWNHHRTLYGDYPRVDIWNIHPYAQAVGAVPFDAQTKVNATIQRIQNFLDFLPSLPPPADSPPEQSKRLDLTELGVLGPEGSIVRATPCAERGCLTQAEFEQEEGHAIAYMHLLLDWLEREPRVSRWYWFHWDWPSNLALDHIGNMNTFANGRYAFFETLAEPNMAAIAYAQRAGSPRLFNPSFEAHYVNQTPYAWGFWAGGPGGDYGYRIDSSSPHAGDVSLRLNLGQQAGEFGHLASVRQPIYSQHYNGKLARVEAWCRTENGGRARLKVNPTNAAGSRNTSWTPGLGEARVCDGWQKIQTDWFILPVDTVNFEVELVGMGANAQVWFDDVELVLAGDLNRSLAVTSADLAANLAADLTGVETAARAAQTDAAGTTVTLGAASAYVHALLDALLGRMTAQP